MLVVVEDLRPESCRRRSLLDATRRPGREVTLPHVDGNVAAKRGSSHVTSTFTANG